jgi:CheY-like chemotaxis protein
VLLVDDDHICREIATELLRERGLGVTTVASGTEALALPDSQRFDLVLMDLHMPGMGGIETARRMRKKPGRDRLPIIAMSAEPLDGDSSRLADAGLDGYISKPVEPATLARVIGRWLPIT